jgi:hypothetical protein
MFNKLPILSLILETVLSMRYSLDEDSNDTLYLKN